MALNWSAIDFDWNQVRAFLATAEEGNLSGAARALGTTQPTIGRQVTALERALGVSLFERTGRGLVLTPSGADMLADVRAMGEAAARISLIAASRSEEVAGRVAISVSDMMAINIMPDILAVLSDNVPEIEVELIVTNDISDLLRREADIAIRHVSSPEPDLISRKINHGFARFYASESFVARHGAPTRMSEARDMPFIGFGAPQVMVDEMAKRGIALPPGSVKLYSGAIFAAWEMVRAGLGIGIMSDEVARRTDGIVPVLQEEPTLPVDMWLVTHRELRTSRRIRVVWDILVEELTRQARIGASP
ncbi:LysR family transcriptional regulator [Hasllibacter sp. MH4015]|uniref:LysR family transcriptional regulator n=1 Tax=Hasllibacter sp. MH4015 TaxID=2854029 RepID=UPI001CD2FB6D|nr:LysR family transcriptional regulator [Hasllibacter sp. MH4015]